MKYASGDVPLGLAYIAASIIKNFPDFHVEIIDTTFHPSFAYVFSRLKKGFDMVFVSAMTIMSPDVKQITKMAKRINPACFVAIGGPQPTINPSVSLSLPTVDAVVIGEGEISIIELIKRITNKSTLDGIPGIWFKNNHNMIKNPPNLPIEQLDQLPFPAFFLLEMDKYIQHWFQLDSYKPNLRGTNMLASRGCPYNCTFCQPTLRLLFGDRLKQRHPANIVAEIAHLKRHYNINSIMFADDTFMVDRKWVFDISDKLINLKLNIFWGCGTRANLVDKDILSKMKKAGLRFLSIGLESASQKILDTVYNKQITLFQVNAGVSIIKSLKLKLRGHFMLGAPGETKANIINTIKFAKRLDLDEATFSITTPLPGTLLYDIAKKNNWIDTNNAGRYDYYKESCFKQTTDLSKKDLYRLKIWGYFVFYLRLKKLKYLIRDFFTDKRFIKKLIIKMKRL